jgi:hypothetical protein
MEIFMGYVSTRYVSWYVVWCMVCHVVVCGPWSRVASLVWTSCGMDLQCSVSPANGS